MAKAKTIKKADVKTDAPVQAKKKERSSSEDRRDYQCEEIYEEGEVVYHKTWDDVGEVIETGLTEDGIRKMKVQFEKVGIKTLCMGHQITA
jgi:transcription elongation factor GreA-like protein